MRYLALKQGARGGVGIAADFWHAKGCDKGRYKGRSKGRGVLKSGLSAATFWATYSADHRRGRTCVVGALVIMDNKTHWSKESFAAPFAAPVVVSLAAPVVASFAAPFVAPFAASLVATVAAFFDVLFSGELLALTRCGCLL